MGRRDRRQRPNATEGICIISRSCQTLGLPSSGHGALVHRSSGRRRSASRSCAQACPRSRGRRLSRTQRAAVEKQLAHRFNFPTVADCNRSGPPRTARSRSTGCPGNPGLQHARQQKIREYAPRLPDKTASDYVMVGDGLAHASRSGQWRTATGFGHALAPRKTCAATQREGIADDDTKGLRLGALDQGQRRPSLPAGGQGLVRPERPSVRTRDAALEAGPRLPQGRSRQPCRRDRAGTPQS